MTIRRTQEQLREEVNRQLEELGDEVFGAIVEETPVATGTLRNGWEHSFDRSESTYTIRNDVEYADEVNDGTSTRRGEFFIERALALFGLRRT